MNAEAVLRDAGWSPSRKVDASDADRAWAAQGWSSHEAGRTFLGAFSGLALSASAKRSPLWFDGARAVDDWDPDWCRAYRAQTGHALLPVGGYSHMLILVDEHGGLWGGFDDLYGSLADSITDLVQVVLLAPGSKALDRRLSADGAH